jgi:hypothetical protein
MKSARERRMALVPESPADEAAPALAPGLTLGRVLGRAGDGWRVAASGGEHVVAADPSIDPALLDDAARSGARVVLEGGRAPVIAGVLLTARPVTVDRAGSVELEVKRLVVTAAESALLRSPGAFLKVGGDELELYANRLVSRARELYRVLGRMVKIN